MTVRGDGRLDIERGQTLSLEAGYQILHEDRYSPESQAATGFAGGGLYAKYPTEYSVTSGRINYVYSPSRLGFEIQATINTLMNPPGTVAWPSTATAAALNLR